MLKKISLLKLSALWLVSLLTAASLISGCRPTQPSVTPPSITQPAPVSEPSVTENATPALIIPSSPAPVPAPTSAPVLLQVTNLAFHDYNGNAAQDSEEPGIEGIELRYEPGGYRTITDRDGKGIANIPAGGYRLYVNDSSRKFRYILPSVSEVREIGDGLNVYVTKNREISIPLGEGFLTLPFDKSAEAIAGLNGGDYFDHDPGPDALWWDGYRGPPPKLHTPRNAHPEIDFYMPVDKFLYASAPGRIHSVNLAANVKYVGIDFGNGFGATYLHISDSLVKPEQFVKRGDKIVISGSSGTPNPHLAFQFYRWEGEKGLCIDPYIPNNDVIEWIRLTNNNGVWVSGSWEWRIYSFEEKWPLIGYWTKSNDPQYP